MMNFLTTTTEALENTNNIWFGIVIGIISIVVTLVFFVFIPILIFRSRHKRDDDYIKFEKTRSKKTSKQYSTPATQRYSTSAPVAEQYTPSMKEQPTTSEQEDSEDYESNSGGFFRFFIKLLLIIGIIIFGLVNYRVLSLNNGFSQNEISGNMTLKEAVLTLTGISKIEYYDTAPFPFNSESRSLYIETSQKNYLLTVSQSEIDALNIVGIFSSKVKPQKITPVPFYVEIIVGIVVLALPFGKRNNRQE